MGRISAEEKMIAVKRRLENGESFEAIGKIDWRAFSNDPRMVQEVSEYGAGCFCANKEQQIHIRIQDSSSGILSTGKGISVRHMQGIQNSFRSTTTGMDQAV